MQGETPISPCEAFRELRSCAAPDSGRYTGDAMVLQMLGLAADCIRTHL
jgi:hypothetical protein